MCIDFCKNDGFSPSTDLKVIPIHGSRQGWPPFVRVSYLYGTCPGAQVNSKGRKKKNAYRGIDHDSGVGRYCVYATAVEA